eukprot:3156721-Rhodomonas_salina.1
MTESAIQLGDHAVRSLTRRKQRSERSGNTTSSAGHKTRSPKHPAKTAAQGWWTEVKSKPEGEPEPWRQSCSFDFSGGIHRRSNTHLKPAKGIVFLPGAGTSVNDGPGEMSYVEKRPHSAVPTMMGHGARVYQNEELKKAGPPPWQWPRSLGPLHGALPPGIPAGIEKGK